jgi:NAD(P)-dependent dehydrogenase (short-subunit alcohol dehydrogenase family)
VALPFSDAYNAAKFAVEGLMESLAPVMREFGVYISVLEPGPVRTAFFANVGGHVDNISDDDPYGELIKRFNRRMAAIGSGGQSAESVADVICEIAADPSPALRYQSSEQSRAIAAQMLVDSTGRSILAATGTLATPRPARTGRVKRYEELPVGGPPSDALIHEGTGVRWSSR